MTVTDKMGPNAANDVTLKNEVKVGVRKKWWRNWFNLTLKKKCKLHAEIIILKTTERYRIKT